MRLLHILLTSTLGSNVPAQSATVTNNPDKILTFPQMHKYTASIQKQCIHICIVPFIVGKPQSKAGFACIAVIFFRPVVKYSAANRSKSLER